MSGDQIGTLVGVSFAWCWGVVGSIALPSPWRAAGLIGSTHISALLAAAALHFSFHSAREFNGPIYGIAVTAEVVAIATAGALLTRARRQSLIPPAVAAIVGLHFIGLWRATGNIIFVWIAGALCVVGLTGAAVPKAARMPVAGLGSALVLWSSVIATLLGS